MGNRKGFTAMGDQLGKLPPVEEADLTGKTVLIVGASTGIGLEAARHFSRMNPSRLILACRSEQRGKAAIASIRETTGYAKADLMLVELGDFSSVKAFLDKVDDEVVELDIVLMNAALGVFEYEVTSDGWERTLQVNYLSSSLISLRLLPKMLETAEKRRQAPRMVIVTSNLHQDAPIEDSFMDAPSVLELLTSEKYHAPYAGFTQYGLTKLLNLLFTIGLADRLPRSKPTIIANCVHPGFCASSLTRDARGIARLIFAIANRLIARSTEQGSRALVWAAVGRPWDADKLQGKYIVVAEPVEPGDNVISERGRKFRDILWHDTLKHLSKIDSKVQSICDQYLLDPPTPV
ncbi:hypothetical protein HGRIS_009097 [Hohenbuehelia grisea]|uniref:NAD(P)-binding protein n=1 Tax=Hohenbuehelia grisea TaxID=104357 RepID=A0ABR3J0G1_9AGAR